MKSLRFCGSGNWSRPPPASKLTQWQIGLATSWKQCRGSLSTGSVRAVTCLCEIPWSSFSGMESGWPSG
nr:hypothetical protein JVH1_3634 [Rhodococcus sp. JVH1]